MRNSLYFQSAFEQLYACQGIASGIGDLRWIRHHDLLDYHNLVTPELFPPENLRQFNLGRRIHYNREPSKLPLEMIKNLLQLQNGANDKQNSRQIVKLFNRENSKIWQIGEVLLKTIARQTLANL